MLLAVLSYLFINLILLTFFCMGLKLQMAIHNRKANLSTKALPYGISSESFGWDPHWDFFALGVGMEISPYLV